MSCVLPGDAPGDLAASEDALCWRSRLAHYAQPRVWRSVMQVSGSVLAYLLLLALVAWLIPRQFALSLLLAPLPAGFALRIFSIQHDCGHGSFLRSRRANDWLGRALSPITLTPYRYWQMAHVLHHASVGHLQRQGQGDIGVMSLDRYRARTPLGRLVYRAYRHPLVLFGIAPSFLYYVRFRLPYHLPQPASRARNSILLTDLALAVVAVILSRLIGVERLLWTFVPATTLAATVGLWLFYVHHDFEHTYWAGSPRWRWSRAALQGSSYYALPRLLQFFTGNTGIHHVHHVCPRIPNYRLPEVLADHPCLRRVNAIGLRASLACAGLALWDERRGRLVSFSLGARETTGNTRAAAGSR